MEIRVFNNLTRKKEIFKPLNPGKVKYYSCGPTTYDFVHVGNARAFVVGDLIHRVFKTFGLEVTFVRNFTDVDDKIIDRANELKVDPIQHADRFVKECEKDMNSLGMLPATHTPKVTETIPEIIVMIEDLIKNGYGYVVDGEVLYHVPKFSEYGKLSKVKLDSLQHGIRVEVDGHKKHPSDFVLWKPAKINEPSWDSPWGKGRPGWHIECSAMAKKFLGNSIDMHHGGVDLQFPHHENEIAQSEAANNCEFCHHWAHNEFLNFGTEKMSKSLGNVITIRSFVEKFSGEILRQLLLSVHYRSKLDWSDEAVSKAINELTRIHEFKLALEEIKALKIEDLALRESLLKQMDSIKEELTNDFNVPGAMGYFFTVIKDFNRESKNGLSEESINLIKKITKLIADSTGLVHENAEEVLKRAELAKMNFAGKSESQNEEVENLILERSIARKNKDWTRSDQIRNRLNELGVVVKDNPDGTVSWSFKA